MNDDAWARYTRYHSRVRDILYVAVVIAFFVVAVLFVRACELVLGAPAERGGDSAE